MVTDKLMIVAHADDESIFAGNLLLRTEGWHLVVVTKPDLERLQELLKVARKLELNLQVLYYKDGWNEKLPEEKLRKDLSLIINRKDWNVIMTHNNEGEYGHIQHRQIHDIVEDLTEEALYFKSGNLLGYRELQDKFELLNLYKSRIVSYDDILDFILRESGYIEVLQRQIEKRTESNRP